jgi:hypothetical protein
VVGVPKKEGTRCVEVPPRDAAARRTAVVDDLLVGNEGLVVPVEVTSATRTPSEHGSCGRVFQTEVNKDLGQHGNVSS